MKKSSVVLALFLLLVASFFSLMHTSCSNEPVIRKISFDSQSGNAVATFEVVEGQKINEPTQPTKNGYSFGGWYEESDCVHEWNFKSAVVVSDMMLYAKWTADEYHISYELEGGANHSENPDEYDVGALPLQFRAQTRTGYTFDGWYTDANFETLIHEIMTGTTGDVVVYAKWGANTYMVSFDSQEGSVPEPASKSVIYGQEYGPLATTTREGFVFDGWWTEANGTGMQVLTASEVSITTDQTLYGKWRDPEVGTIGQAGGYIFFDKGIYSNGWRYLESEFLDFCT